MSDDRPVDRAFAGHGGFESTDGEYVSTATPFEATAVATERDGAWQFRVTVRVPTLSAAVEEGDVGDAVESGWFDTFSLRVADAYDVVHGDPEGADPVIDRTEDRVTVELAFEASDPVRGVDDAAALVNFVEGTYVQGVIPGYEYGEPVASLLHRARQAGSTGSPGRGDDHR